MYLVECFNDETVLRVLGVHPKRIRRMKGKGNVLNKLKKEVQEAHIGLVDRDARSLNPVPLAPFMEKETRQGLALYVWGGNRLVVVDDKIEDWIFRAAAQAKVRLPRKDAHELHRLEARVMHPLLLPVLEELVKASPKSVVDLQELLGLK